MTGPMIIRTSFVRASEELEIAYRPWGSERFGGLPIVAVHDDWSTSAAWTRLAAELTERWILAPDLRGRGRTRAPDHGYSIAEHADDLAAFLDAMERKRVHLVGHGLGAAICAELAMRAPERVATLALISLPWVDGMSEEHADREQAKAYKADARAFARAQAELAPAAPRDMLWATLIEAGHKQRLEAALATLDALSSWRPSDALGELAMPRRLIDGQLDPITGGEVAARAAQALGCERVTLPGVGHHPPLEAPEPVAEIIRGLIASS
jgi:pimeloyl-ACP methyl ester carboxylesterase